MMPHITLHMVTDAAAYWTLFWSLLYALCPPRETINSAKYNKFLEIVNYYGSLNIRSLVMKVLYSAPPPTADTRSPAPPVPPKP
jgi:hypothetical protein